MYMSEVGAFSLARKFKIQNEQGQLLQGTTPNVFLKVCDYLFIYYLLFNTDYSEQHWELFDFE